MRHSRSLKPLLGLVLTVSILIEITIYIIGFIPVVPDFVIELRSPSDRAIDLRGKMWEYRRLGVKLGLSVNPQDGQLEIYRPGREVEILNAPLSVDCGGVLPGFVLSLAEIW